VSSCRAPAKLGVVFGFGLCRSFPALPAVVVAKGQEEGDVELANAALVMNDA
jgi:hypothetical protein